MEQEPPNAENTEIEDSRAELIRLSNAGEIKQSESYLKKASGKVIMKIRREYIVAQREKANVVLAGALIEKISDLMEAINMVDSGNELRLQDTLFGVLRKTATARSISVRFLSKFHQMFASACKIW